jgi:V8-like Glu-specific endopeptidase
VNANRTRVRYATNTEDGSSGSPCFNATWGLIALHHFGEPNVKPATYNQGVPIDVIRDRLARVGRADALGDELP